MIKFLRTREKYGPFSNFSKHAIIVSEEEWSTTEAWYQAEKFTDLLIREYIRTAPTPKEAKNRAYEYPDKVRPDWENVKIGIMRDAVHYKITAHPEIKDLLLSTGDEELVEDNKKDQFWGIGNGTGQNWLGKLWMELREELKQAEARKLPYDLC